LTRLLLLLVRAYRLTISPFLPCACRFEPSCSEFALESLRRHGAWSGSRLALSRIARCHPWHAGGYDPVPGGEDGAPTEGRAGSPVRHPNVS